LSVFPKCVRSHIAPPLLLLAPLHRLLLGRRKARFAQRPAQRPQGLPIHELIQQGAEHLEALAAPLTSEEDIDDALHDAPSHDVPLAVASLRLAIALPNYIVIPRQHRILMRRYFRRRGAALAGELRNWALRRWERLACLDEKRRIILMQLAQFADVLVNRST
jgi:hypothetical protein